MIDYKVLRKRGMELKPTIHVGKSGITDGIAGEIDSQLDNTELVKIKFLKSAGPSSYWKDEITRVSEKIKVKIIEIKGGTVLMYRPTRK